MDERRAIPPTTSTSNRRAPAAHRGGGVLGSNGTGVHADHLSGSLAHWARSIPQPPDRFKDRPEAWGRWFAMTRASHVMTVMVAASYLTLGIFSPDDAAELWAPYAVVMFVLAILNLAQ